jgi:hypothetical protein
MVILALTLRRKSPTVVVSEEGGMRNQEKLVPETLRVGVRIVAFALAVALIGGAAQRAAAQCCACTGCGAGFCADGLENAVACAELCEDSGCPDQAFQVDDDCTGGCDGQPDLPTATPSVMPDDTPTASPTVTGIPTGTDTPTVTPTDTAVDTPTPTETPIDTATPTDTPIDIATPTDTPVDIATPTGTPTGTASATVTPTGTPTGTAAATFTSTPTGTPTGTAAATFTSTPTGTPTGTAAATVTTTPTSTPTVSVTPTPTGGFIRIQVGTAVGRPGSTVGFAVTLLFDDRFDIIATHNLIDIDAAAPFATSGAAPDCTVNPALQKPDSEFTFLPDACEPGVDCQNVDAVVAGPSGSPVIAEGSVLYTCRIAIPADAEDGTYPLDCSGLPATNAQGASVNSTCNAGEVIVESNITGDCNGDGFVTIEELIVGVNISLGNQPITNCPAYDTNGDGEVTIEELIQAVNNALAT